MDRLREFSESSVQNPMATFDSIRKPGLDAINRGYMDVPGQVATQMARRGYGSSGDMGNSQYKVALARTGAVSDFEGKLAAAGIDRQNAGASLGTNLLNLGRGTTGTSTTPDTSAGNAFMSAGNGLSNLSTLLMLSNVLKGSGGGSSGGGGGSPSGWAYPGG